MLGGYGFVRPCRVGHKIGPLFADDPTIARGLINSLLAAVRGDPVALDVPEPNAAGLAIVNELGWRQSFGCARMVSGMPIAVPIGRIFGVTSFEFG